MNRIKLPIAEILVQDRQRPTDAEHVDSLAESIRDLGLIQPIVVNQEKRIIAGGHRLAACVKLGWTEIDVVYRETLTEDELQELELTENIKRKNLTWQENCIAVAKIHALKKRRGALDGNSWGMRETGTLLGVAASNVHYCVTIAKELLKSSECPFWKCENLSDAWKLIMRQQEELAHAELAKRAKETSLIGVEKPKQETIDDYLSIKDTEKAPEDVKDIRRQVQVTGYLALSKDEAKKLYLANPLNPPEEFELYYSEKCAALTKRINDICLSNRFFHVDCIQFMNDDSNRLRFDHIITDIPYGIDMDMLDQSTGMKNIDLVAEEHTVDGNLNLIKAFFPAAYKCTKENAFVITWCDQMLWQTMYDCAVSAGFKVQRWPVTWVKSHRCMNQAAQYNFTKNTEIAIVCRKGKATMVEPQLDCVITAGRDILCEHLGHPFAKPFAVWEKLVKAVSIEGQVILEPFMGRMSGVISMLQLNRNVFGCELNEQHYNAGLENLKDHYKRINSNATFS